MRCLLVLPLHCLGLKQLVSGIRHGLVDFALCEFSPHAPFHKCVLLGYYRLHVSSQVSPGSGQLESSTPSSSSLPGSGPEVSDPKP